MVKAELEVRQAYSSGFEVAGLYWTGLKESECLKESELLKRGLLL